MLGKIRFGVYELDRDAMELRKHGVPLRLQEQPFRVLAMLAERPGEVISREQLQAKIWGNTFVDFDLSLNKAVNRVREALNDNAGTPSTLKRSRGGDTDLSRQWRRSLKRKSRRSSTWSPLQGQRDPAPINHYPGGSSSPR
jgi:Transcriptional regulatory protein, C terminal